ncbi:CRISPR-associated endonuclease Cas2 [Streptococcus sp. DD11]|uniref:CRISPR-associated endonuclease Cas2 n=1 Tax=Streptococcus sp. DD11 TaxID=1777879 RepID=UPI000AE5E6E0|nr:CRISPR-associated endonuclease Cas2 [Streptococcus sp. DD11]
MAFYNLDEASREFAKKKSKFCLVIYDIVSNKRRLKLAKLLEGYGTRVQRSCFEVDIEKLNFDLLITDLRDFYQADEEDNIIVYVGHKEETVVFNPYTGAELLEEILFF